MSSIVFITYDLKKDEYPAMPYSVATMIASLKMANHVVSHYSFDIQHVLEEKSEAKSLTEELSVRLKANIEYFSKFDYIAISLTAWTIDYVHVLLDYLKDYRGVVILGGYEVTAMSEDDLVSEFPRANHFIKGYAETALRNILSGECKEKVISAETKIEDTASPYLSNVLNLFSKKIHWETKRGCPYKCGFCEWGNATKSIFDFDDARILAEIELFKTSNISEINILDGTYNWGKNYLKIFKNLLEIPSLNITCQSRFEALSKGDGIEFFELCKKHKSRIHLEFGIQSIHNIELECIGRNNDMALIQDALRQLNESEIDYEVSIIYAIPGQTVESFIDTIEFLIANGCEVIKAYPLRIPKNSLLEKQKTELKVIEAKNDMNITSVVGSYSFTEDQRNDMDRIANRLNSGILNTHKETPPVRIDDKRFVFERKSEYQWRICSTDVSIRNQELIDQIVSDYITPAIDSIKQEDIRQHMSALGFTKEKSQGRMMTFINEIINHEFFLELKKTDLPVTDENTNPEIQDLLASINPNIVPKRYYCDLVYASSGNIYVMRSIVPTDSN